MISFHAGGERQSSPVVWEWQSSLLLFGAVLLVDARGKKGVCMGVRAVILRRGKNGSVVGGYCG